MNVSDVLLLISMLEGIVNAARSAGRTTLTPDERAMILTAQGLADAEFDAEVKAAKARIAAKKNSGVP